MFRTALIVEDDTLVLNGYCRGVERTASMQALPAPDLLKARELLGRHRPDLAIVDLVLPDGSGLDLIAELRSADAKMFIVLVSAFASIECAVHAMRAGANDVISKPVTFAEILHRVGSHGEPEDDLAKPATLDSAIWNHIHRVLADCGGNISMTARLLRVHRSRLRRILAQQAPHD
jgi:two-component system response regulator RegA